MLKKRNIFSFANGEEAHAKSTGTKDESHRISKVFRYHSTPAPNTETTIVKELPEDILADSTMFKQKETPPVWKRKRFHFVIGLSVGLLAAYGASTTPTAQTHLNELHSYLALQIADMIPVTDIVDEIFGNVTNFFTPVPSSDQSFMPAIKYK